MLKALLISVLIASVLSTVYGLGAILLVIISEQEQSVNIGTAFHTALGAFVVTFPFIAPIVWLFAFALLQRFRTKIR